MVRLVKAMVFPVVMYGCESWTVKKAECRRIDAFELWCWRRLLRVPWTARRSNPSILKAIIPGCSLEGLMLKLKLQYFATLCEELTHWKRPWCWEGLRTGGEGDDRGLHGWMASPTRWTWVWVNSGSWWWTGRPAAANHVVAKSQTWLSDWTELNWTELNWEVRVLHYKVQSAAEWFTLELFASWFFQYLQVKFHWEKTYWLNRVRLQRALFSTAFQRALDLHYTQAAVFDCLLHSHLGSWP